MNLLFNLYEFITSSPDMLTVILITFGMFGLFLSNRIRAGSVALLTACALMLTGVVTPEEGVSGFSNNAVVTIFAMLVISVAIQKTGIIYNISKRLMKYADKKIWTQILVIGIIAAPFSAFVSNTATVAILIPMLISIAMENKTAPTKTLIPLSYIAQMGGMLTIIGTSVNILANNIVADYGLTPLGMFSITGMGLVVLVVGWLYLTILGNKLLPDEKIQIQETETYWAQVKIPTESKYVGKTILQFKKMLAGIEVKEIIRGDRYIVNFDRVHLQEGDILNLNLASEAVARVMQMDDLVILTDFDPDRRKLHSDIQKIVRVAINSKRTWVGKTMRQINFFNKFGFRILAVHYRNEPQTGNLRDCSLQNGDILILAAHEQKWSALQHASEFVFLDEVEADYEPKDLILAVGVLIAVVSLAALNILPIMLAALCGVAVLLLSRVISLEDIYRQVNWEVVLVLAGILPLGIALERVGITEFITQMLVQLDGGINLFWVLLVFYLIITIITELISNAAVAIIFTPIGIELAMDLGVNPIAFVLVVMFAASTSFLTPIGNQTNTMVYVAGNYRFMDFMKIGIGLNLILALVVSGMISWFWV